MSYLTLARETLNKTRSGMPPPSVVSVRPDQQGESVPGTEHGAEFDAIVPEKAHAHTPRRIERWPLAAELGLSRCKRCRGAILFGEVVEICNSEHADGRPPRSKAERWVILDPDLMPHGCGTPLAGRVVTVDASEGNAKPVSGVVRN
jgi:hypothetical protein